MAKILKHLLVFCVPVWLLAGCASYSGKGLAPGASEAEVVALMGKPAEVQTRPNGDKVLFYPRLPVGRDTYAVTLGPSRRLRSIEQRLTYENISRIVPKRTTKAELRELLGPPYRAERSGWRNSEIWEYPWRLSKDQRVLWVEFDDDGTAREVIDTHDYSADPPGGSS